MVFDVKILENLFIILERKFIIEVIWNPINFRIEVKEKLLMRNLFIARVVWQ